MKRLLCFGVFSHLLIYASPQLSAQVLDFDDPNALFNFAEEVAPDLFSPAGVITSDGVDDWLYRFYPETESYAAVHVGYGGEFQCGGVYTLGGPFGDEVVYIDTFPNLMLQVNNVDPNGGQSSNYSLSGKLMDDLGAAINCATVKLAGAGKTFFDITRPDGNFTLVFDRTGLPDNLAYTVSRDGFIPQANILSLDSSSGNNVGNMAMEIKGSEIVALEAIPELHHLGNDDFVGSNNSQFQKGAEGLVFQRTFTVNETQLTSSNATITLLVKGSQDDNTLMVNSNLVGILPLSPTNGAFGPVSFFDIPISFFNSGVNSLVITSDIGPFPPANNYDDFEFANVIIQFN